MPDLFASTSLGPFAFPSLLSRDFHSSWDLDALFSFPSSPVPSLVQPKTIIIIICVFFFFFKLTLFSVLRQTLFALYSRVRAATILGSVLYLRSVAGERGRVRTVLVCARVRFSSRNFPGRNNGRSLLNNGRARRAS